MATPEEAYAKALEIKVTKDGDFDIVSIPDDTLGVESLISAIGTYQAREDRIDERAHELQLGALQGQTATTVADFNLQGVQAQSEATKFAATESAGATKFAATEAAGATKVAAREAAGATKFAASEAARGQIGAATQVAGATKFAATEAARGAIESQRVAGASQERQVSLKGTQDRLLAVEQGGQERLNIETTGGQQRATQRELLGSQERQIGLTGEQQRLLAQEQGRQQRETDLQNEKFRRYKEAKDAAQASRAFRA
jgi:hypothetical protein